MSAEKIIVAVVVYDRFDNIREWVRSFNMCENQGAQLIIIHNYENEDAKSAYTSFCEESGVYYVPRKNIGYDIGAFQDVCRGRLENFPNEWDYIIWCTDDTLPMRKDFVHQMVHPLRVNKNVGCTAMEISPKVKLHIRTTGFCVSQEIASKLEFQAEPIKTKEDCYQFEHRNKKSFYEQILSFGLRAVQVETVEKSPFWDMGRPPKPLQRRVEHYSIFPLGEQSNKKVTVICLIYNSYPEILSSMINQTHQDWELLLIHDGPETAPVNKWVGAADDRRVMYTQTGTRKGNWGHYWRQWALNGLKSKEIGGNPDYVLITNADNHYPPMALELMLKGFEENPDAVGAYCSKMVHSYIKSDIINCRLQQGYIDCGGMLIRRKEACEVGWRDVKSHSSDWIFFDDLIKMYGAKRFQKVEGCLLIHN